MCPMGAKLCHADGHDEAIYNFDVCMTVHHWYNNIKSQAPEDGCINIRNMLKIK